MSPVVFHNVSPRSLGDLLKGYGVMAVLGEAAPATRFWWDDAFHLVADEPTLSCVEARDILQAALPGWAVDVGAKLRPNRGSKKKGTARQPSALQSPSLMDALDPALALSARAVAVPRSGDADNATAHPAFPSFGQEGSADYFAKLEEAGKKVSPRKQGKPSPAVADLEWSLFGQGDKVLKPLDKGMLFFPEAQKRYAVGVAKWVQEKDAPFSAWCYILALRGALALRGSLRRPRFARRSYPAFPFVFDGTVTESGWVNREVHLPTWTAEHPRTLNESLMQVRQFQARLGAGGFATTAAEFRIAVQGRGAGAAFDAFHRFVLEGRKPGQKEPMRQAILRGMTKVGGGTDRAGNLRLMLESLDRSGWLDQLRRYRRPHGRYIDLRPFRAPLDAAIHRAVDEPKAETYLAVLEAIWNLNVALCFPSKLRRGLEDAGRAPVPSPQLSADLWEPVFLQQLQRSPEWRVARALGSIFGVAQRMQSGLQQASSTRVGPILSHLLPLEFDARWRRWIIPDPAPTRSYRWSGLQSTREFAEMFWYRWFDAAELDRLPFVAKRTAALDDILRLLRGELDVAQVHRLAKLFALLDWSAAGNAPVSPASASKTGRVLPLSPAYSILRSWLELGIHPAEGARPPRDGDVVRLLCLRTTRSVKRAVMRAMSRLRTDGVPWRQGHERPFGKLVVDAEPDVPQNVADVMPLAIMIPLSQRDTLRLAESLLIPPLPGEEHDEYR